MKIYFIRHGQSEYNVNRLINQNPKIKVNLTKKGVKQALLAGERFSKTNFDVIFSSEFLRTHETAKLIKGNRKAEIIFDKRISEIRLGFEGLPVEIYNAQAVRDLLNFRIKGKESWIDVKKRAADFVDFLKGESYDNVLVVTHEVVVQCALSIFGKLSNIEARTRKIKNCEFFEFEL